MHLYRELNVLDTALIDSFLRDNESDYQTLWELLKMKMKELSISYSKRRGLERKIILVHLYSELNDLDTALDGDPQCIETQRKREQVKLKLSC